jgi:hypothetical protein
VKFSDENKPVRTKAVLIDPASMKVIWMNEMASQDLPSEFVGSYQGVDVEKAVPMAKALDLLKALSIASDSGESQHLRADLISSNRGKMSTVASVYRLPDGNLLLLTEIGWQLKDKRKEI